MHLKHGLSAALIGTSIAIVASYSQTANALTAPEVSKIAKQITVRIESQVGGKVRGLSSKKQMKPTTSLLLIT
jgi:hypothetical protein